MVDDLKYPEPNPNKRQPSEVWDERYNSDSYLYGKEPLAFLKHYLSALKKGKAIDVGMGEGRNAVFLAQNGFEVEGIDCSKKAIQKAQRLSDEKGVKIDARLQNLDFFLMPLMKYQTIVMTYFKPQARFFSEIRRGLVAGGTFALEAYLVGHLKSQSQPNPYLEIEECYKSNEALGYIKDFHVLYYKELPDGNNHIVQLIAEKRQ